MTLFNSTEPSVTHPDDAGAMTVVNWAGALASFLLMVGLIAWSYQLLKRDVSGVPVVRALEGPMRVAPEDPGGIPANHQGLSVTQVSAEGAFEAPIERVILAPPPVQMSAEDRPAQTLEGDTPAAPASDAVAETVIEPALDTEIAQVPDPESAGPSDPVAEALAEALGLPAEGGAPGSVFLISEANAPRDSARVKVIPASVAGVVTSPRPIARPANLVIASIPAAAPAQSAESELASSEIPAGTRLVQLGAYPDEDTARAAWTALVGEFGTFLGDRQRVIQKAEAGGTTFYRLRALGFEGLDDARQFCAVLVAQNANCIPVIKR